MKVSKKIWTSDFAVMGYFAAFNLLLHLIAIKGYGYFRDEFYYISCSDHLGFGFVDQPPLSAFILKLIRMVSGDSVIAIRILPVLCGALFVFLAGLIAKELGGKKFAVALACTAAFAPIGNFFIFNFYSMNALDLVIWQVCILIVIRIIKTGEPKYWLTFGLAAGLGLMNKISVLYLGFAIFAGILLSKERKYLKNKYIWLGLLIAGLLFLPYIVWNATHDWATLEFIYNAKTYKMATVSPLNFLKGQILYNNPATLIIWLAGLWYFFFHKDGKKYRLFGWMFLTIYVLLTLQQAKDYYMAGAYIILFAGGAIQFEHWLQKKRVRWLKPVVIVFILVPTLLLCPMALPILPVDTAISWIQRIGISGSPGERHEMGVLPQHYADMHGWEEMVEKVSGVYNTLSPEEQKECIIYATNYGVTGAINLLGKKYGLPPAFSGHNNHFYWPPRGYTGNVLIAVGGRQKDHEISYRHVAVADRTNCRFAMPYENNKPIYICRGIKRGLEEIWPTVKHFN